MVAQLKSKPVRPKANKASSSIGKRAAIIIIFVTCLVIFANSINNHFVFDDSEVIVTNNAITSLANIPIILGLTTGKPYYRPLRTASYTLDYFFSGLDPTAYHIFNITYHAIASVLVYLIVLFLLGSHRAALIAGLIFAVHPVQTDSVTYLSGRRDVLCGLFYFLGFYYFLKFRENSKGKYLVIVFLSYVLAMASKEMAVTLVGIFFVYDFLTNIEQGPFFSRIFRGLKDTLVKHRYFYPPLFLLGSAFVVYKVVVKSPSHAAGYYGGSILNNVATVARVVVHYVKLLLFPLTLNADYSYNAFPASRSILEPAVLFSLAILFLLGGLIVYCMTEKKKWFAFSGLWFFVTLLPVMQIFPHHELLAEHYLYIPIFGFALLLALLFEKTFTLFTSRTSVVYIVLVMLLFLLSVRTIIRNRDWKDDLTLWTKTVQTSPDCVRARNNLGRALNNEGDFSAAIDQFRHAVQVKPDYAEAYCNMGVAYSVLGLAEQARSSFRKAIELNPEFDEAYYNVGLLDAQNGNLTEAIESFKKAIEFNSKLVSAYFNLGLAYLKTADRANAFIQFKRVLELSPDSPVAEKTKSILATLRE